VPQNKVVQFALGLGMVLIAGVLIAGSIVMTGVGSSDSSASGPVITSASPTTSRTTTTTRTTTRTTTSTPTVIPTPTGNAALGDNPLYADFNAGLIRQPCSPVGYPSDPAAAEAFYAQSLPCLNNAWRPLIEGARMRFNTAAVLVPSGTSVTSPCGTTSVGPDGAPAFYCSSNETIYMPLVAMADYKYEGQAIAWMSLLGHEFGHHVQKITGTLRETNTRAREVGSTSEPGLELSRRLELQAQCFGGMFIGSIIDSGGRFTGSDYDVALDDALRGDWNPERKPRDHGTPQHGQSWWLQGARDNKIGQCNTWLSPPGDVS
jgi:predicted metalloprotease